MEQSILVPNDELTHFYRTQLIHILLTNDRESGVHNDCIIGRVGSMGYGCYCNEVCMLTMELDRRGMFDEARRILQTFITYQGTVGLNGEYEDIDGISLEPMAMNQGMDIIKIKVGFYGLWLNTFISQRIMLGSAKFQIQLLKVVTGS